MRCTKQKELRGHCVPRPTSECSQVIDKGGTVSATCNGHTFDDGVIAHVPLEHAQGAAHADAPRHLPHWPQLALMAGSDAPPDSEGELRTSQPRGKLPALQDPVQPCVGEPLEGLALVGEEGSGALRDGLVVGRIGELRSCIRRRPKYGPPKGKVRSRRVWADPFQVPVDLADVAPAITPAFGGLPLRKLGFDGWANNFADRGAEEPAEAGGQLQGAPFLGFYRVGQLGDPHEKVVGRPQDTGQGDITDGAGVVSLPQEVATKAAPWW